MRKIAVISGTRADYGLLFKVIKGLHDDPVMELQLIVTGAHLSPDFGMTVNDIEKDGFPIAERVEILLSSDTEEAIAVSMGRAVMGMASAYARLKPDMIVLLGDRYEIHAAASAAVPFRIPVAHIHGGEVTEGAVDELFRHSITKLSHIHFTSTEAYARRVRQMGERPENVYCTGAPGLDNIFDMELMDKDAIAKDMGIPGAMPWGVATYHPVTAEASDAEEQVREFLAALGEHEEVFWVLTYPGADAQGRKIIEAIKEHAGRKEGRAALFSSLGQLRYLSLLKCAALMAGNSSSGIIEAPSFKLPVVNIGSRQDGRIRAANVIDVPKCGREDISAAIDKAMSEDFRASLKGLENPYGDGKASARILEILKGPFTAEGLRKRFVDIKDRG